MHIKKDIDYNEFYKDFNEFKKSYDIDDMYNLDETELYIKILCLNRLVNRKFAV